MRTFLTPHPPYPPYPAYPPFIFLISHRATIVNIAAIHDIDRWIDGGLLVRLKDDKRTEFGVARDRVRELKQRLGI